MCFVSVFLLMSFGAVNGSFYSTVCSNASRLLPALAVWAASLGALRADSVVVFNELMYHPPTNEVAFEWVELHNQMAVDVDMSGWSIAGGIHYQFPEATVIAGGGYLVVAVSPADLVAATGLTNVLGPFAGRLSNAGDTLELRNNNNRLMDKLDYGVEGAWPVGPDGSGVSLAKRDPDAASARPENWTASAQVGGTPGVRNFTSQRFETTTSAALVLGSTWRFDASGAEPNVQWRETLFDDSVWSSGQGLFRSGSAVAPLGDPQPLPSFFSTGVGEDGVVLAPGSADPHYLLTVSAQSAPPPPPIAATVIENHPAWAANDAASSWIGPVNPGTANVAEGNYYYRTTFALAGFDPATTVLRFNIGADNRLNDVLLNGVSKGLSYAGFSTLSGVFTLTNGFVAGTNTLDFLSANDGSGANPAGFRVKASGTARRRFDARTTLPTGLVSYYFRTKFVLDGAPQVAALTLDTVTADGAVFYLNGAEVLRVNMPAGAIGPSTLAASNVVTPAYLGPFPLSTSSLVKGTNVLAVEVHQGPARGNKVLFGADLAVTATNFLFPPPITIAFNEVSSATNADFWIELVNSGPTGIDLGGCVLARQGGATNREYVFPSQTVAPGAMEVVTKATLGFGADPGDRLFLYSPGRSGLIDAIVAKREPRGRWPDGTGRWCFPVVPTPGASNRFAFHDEVVINEIMYHAPTATTVPGTSGADQASESWIELYNRGSTAVDLTGWRLQQDVGYEFPPVTSIPAGGYLVVAKDVDFMRTNYPGITVLGPFTGKLRHGSGHLLLVDTLGNPANEVRYFDSKPWPEYADGGGSSLELRDPWADNSKAAAWAASIESGGSGWSNYTYRGVASNLLGPTQWREFVIGLLDAGECLIDDMSVVESPSGTPVLMLQNGGFENGLATWRALGDHSRSRVEVDPDNPANHVLHLIATGPTDHLHNHLETTFANNRAVTNGREYQISFRAKWLAGNNCLNTRLYFNRVARTTAILMPSRHGTPGALNSTSATNIGPTFTAFGHSPLIPKPSEPVTVRVSASDPQGVGAVTLRWSINGGAWATMPMPARLAAEQPGYTNYSATLPAQPAGTVVQFFVQATDGAGVTASFPPGGANSRAIWKVDEGKAQMPLLHRVRLLMTPSDAAFLHAHTNVMSNERLGVTVVYDEREVFYDAGVHLQSSERGRDDSSRAGFTVRLPADQLFRGAQSGFTIDRSGGYSGRGGRHDEILLWHAVNHAGGIPGLDCDLVQCFAPRIQEDSTGMLRMSAFDAGYFDAQSQNGGNGNVYTLELIYYPTTSVNNDPQAPKLPQPDDVINVDIQGRGEDKENYRWVFLQDNHADQDDYSQVVALNKAFSLSGAALETQTSRLMDVDEWMRTLAFKAFTGDVDTFTYGLNHNWKVYFRPEDGKAVGLLWDMDFSYVQSINYASPGTGSPTTYKIAKLPNNYRRFCNHLLDISTTTVNAAYLGPWATRYSRLLGQNWSSLVTYLQQRATYLRGTLPLTTPFAITTNGGRGLSTTNDHLTLTGTAPLAVKDIQVNGVTFPLTWSTLTNWNLTVPLPGYTNRLALQGVDNHGNLLTNAVGSITVTNTGAYALETVVVNEWMADNSGPGGFLDPADGRFSDWIELYNPNTVPVNLSGWFMTDSFAQPDKWTIPTNTFIAGRGFLLVWADGQTNLNGLGAGGDLHANFQLGRAGDGIGLFAPDGTPRHGVVFGPQSQNVSQGLFPDGDTNALFFMTNWTPRAANRMGLPPFPQIGGIAVHADGVVSFDFSAIPGRTYRVEYKDDLSASAWAALGGSEVAIGPSVVVTDTLAAAPQRFYRVVLLQ